MQRTRERSVLYLQLLMSLKLFQNKKFYKCEKNIHQCHVLSLLVHVEPALAPIEILPKGG